MTPLMQQYYQIKSDYKDAILFFRLGDFYEMFEEDAKLAAPICEITLTAKEIGNGLKIPMCGVPYHAADIYISKLVERGYKVAICEQMEDPAVAKGIVKREVIRTLTPGITFDLPPEKNSQNNFLVSISVNTEKVGISVVDVSTGEMQVTEISNNINLIKSELDQINPSECLLIVENKNDYYEQLKESYTNIRFTKMDIMFDWKYYKEKLCEHFEVKSLDGFGCEEMHSAIIAAGAAIDYITLNLKVKPHHIRNISLRNKKEILSLDTTTKNNLELVKTIKEGKTYGSLLWVIDKTYTPMGTRLLRRWVEEPLTSVNLINERLDAIEELTKKKDILRNLTKHLNMIQDIERLGSRIACAMSNPKELISLKLSIEKIPHLRKEVEQLYASLFKKLNQNLDNLEDITKLISDSIMDDPPRTLKEGDIIKEGYNSEVDELRKIKKGGRKWIFSLEEEERKKTGIKSLKIGFNKVFGYYIEVTKPNLSQVPSNYIRKQTLSTGERFITEELKVKEEQILDAEEKLVLIETQLFIDIREKIGKQVARIHKSARCIAELDAIISLAQTAIENKYIRPIITNSDKIVIKNGKHPVLDKILGEYKYISNDTEIDTSENQIHIITGPNMAGKSTYMRQVALIVIMAQMGSFIPATYAEIGIVDKIFTRVGAVDDISRGMSTFMVEMLETAFILNNSTSSSLILLDEIGRGTSTADGINIARAVVNYIHNKIGAKTLFATHFHELTSLEQSLPKVKNFHVSAKEHSSGIIFSHKVMPGGSSKSFGIEVAKFAGLPDEVIKLAKELSQTDSDQKNTKNLPLPPEANTKPSQLSFFIEVKNPVIEKIKQLDVENLSPIEALNFLWEIKKEI